MIAERLSKRVMVLKSCSRTEAEGYIANGFVRVNGQVVEAPQTRVGDERVEIDAHASLLEATAVTLLLNKPPGFEAMAGLEHASRDVQPAIALLKAASLAQANASSNGPGDATGRNEGKGQARPAATPLKRHFTQLTACVPLETAASGLVVFTQDWRIARKLMDDAAFIEHELMVEVAGEVSPQALQKLSHRGLHEDSNLPPVKASVSSTSDTSTKLRFAVKGSHPGLVLWLCERADLHIESMKRIRVGRVGLGQVPVGQWRYLSAHERF
jgi:23S rRNA pseudouridine2604 synthase